MFDLVTGSRLPLEYFLGRNRQEAIRERLADLGEGARFQKDNFYIDTQGHLVPWLPSRQGRVEMDLSDLVIREF